MMKKVFLCMVMLFPVFAFANTCENVIDTQTNNDRVITCDKKTKTVTTFKTTKEVLMMENDVCKISCNEELIFSIDPIKKVLAGTSFNYPLYASGVRKCTATYNYEKYEKDIKTLVDQYASLTGTEKDTKGREIVNLYDKKRACDEFTKSGSDYEKKYKIGGEVVLNVETSTEVKNINCSYKEISDYNSTVDIIEERYSSCNYNEANRTCGGSNKTISSWTETAKVFGKFTMPDTFIEKYTGKDDKVSSSNACNAGDRYFTDFTELTKPVTGAINDNGYTLTLKGSDIGNNITNTNPRWNLTINCFYQVKNLAFPQGGSNVTSGGEVDENFEKYGNNAFIYRQIDLSDPFPGNREPGANWYQKVGLISSNIPKNSKFTIKLNNSTIRKIRDYNSTYTYEPFNLDGNEKSHFVENYAKGIITRD